MSSSLSVDPEQRASPVGARQPANPTGGWRQWVRRAAVACLALVIAVNFAIFGGVVVTRMVGRDPRSQPPVVSIENLRRVDDRLWIGDQPTPGGYEQLVQEHGVTLVVNLRTGQGPDPEGDDPALIRSLGADYVRVPIHDGHAPDRSDVQRFLEVVASAPERVYVHCGGGVGRSSVMEAAYRSSRGQSSRLGDQLQLGPLSVEQSWFVATAEPGRSRPVPRAVRIFSRVVDFPRPAFSWMAKELV